MAKMMKNDNDLDDNNSDDNGNNDDNDDNKDIVSSYDHDCDKKNYTTD